MSKHKDDMPEDIKRAARKAYAEDDVIAALERAILAERQRSPLDFINAHVNLEITWGEIDGWEDDCQWRVHRVNGGRSDREWTLVGHGKTVEAAIEQARAAILTPSTVKTEDE